MTDIQFVTKVSAALRGADLAVVLAPKSALDGGWHRKALGTEWAAALDRVVDDAKPGDLGSLGSTYGPAGAPRRVVVAALPDKLSRHNSATRSEALLNCLAQAGLEGTKSAVVFYLDDASHYTAAAASLARVLPLFDTKTGGDGGKGRARVVGVLADGTPVRADALVKATTESVRLAARLVDTPPQEMTTAEFEKEARAALKGIKGMRVTSIVGDQLLRKGMGGIHGVGRTAVVAPRMLVMDYKPSARPQRTVALVGKGIVYDTGGLNIKVGGHMSNMKCDMGGAAAVLGALRTLARTRSKTRVVGIACLAENAVGPHSYRPDDILHMHSGKTVEINNTDAEGRVVLADGVSYAARDVKADLIIDAATLTGAALIATGHAISCCVSNRGGLETLARECGRATGDLTHPLPFAPELYRQEFASKVADMRNSVKDRMNAQTSAAAQFIYNHIEELDPPWLHLDIAGPAFRSGRGTGHGAPLMAEIVRRVEAAHLADD